MLHKKGREESRETSEEDASISKRFCGSIFFRIEYVWPILLPLYYYLCQVGINKYYYILHSYFINKQKDNNTLNIIDDMMMYYIKYE